MRKILSFLMLFCVYTGIAWAQTQYSIKAPTTNLTDGKYVIVAMSDKGTGPCLYSSTYTGNRFYRYDTDKSAISAGDILESKYVWDVTLSGEQISIKWSDDNTKFFPADAGRNQNFTGTTVALLTPEVKTINGINYIALTLTDANVGYIHANAPGGHPNLSYWNAYGDDGSCVKFQFYPAKEVSGQVTSVTFNYYEGETKVAESTKEFEMGTTITLAEVPAIDYFVNASFKSTGDIVATESASYDINCTANFPFTPMTITDGQFASDDFYTLTINNQGVRPVVYVGEGNSPVHTKVGTQALTKGNLWAFKRVSGYTVELYNLAVGATSPLKAKSQNGVAVTFNTSDASYTSQFIIKKNGANFVLYCSNGDNRDLNACMNIGGANNGLGVWSPDNNQHNDAGSTFIIGSVEQSLQDLVTEILSPAPELELDANYSTDDYVYSSSMAIPEAISTAAENYNTTPNGSTLAALLDAMEDNPNFEPGYTNNISADKFYQLISYNDENCQGKAIYSISGCGKEGGASNYFDRELYIETAVGQRPVAETAFQFVADGDGYDIIHANSNYHFSNIAYHDDMANPDLPIYKGATIVIENQRGKSNVWSFRSSDNTEKYLHCGTGDGSAIVRQESPADNDGNLWLIKEIKNVPVTIGAAKWATLCLPMAVTVPEDATLKVFYVTGVDAEDNLTLEEVAAGTTLAKKQPVLLYSTSANESDTYQFAVSTATGTTLEGNILSGSTARRGDFSTATSEYYALANKTEGVGFYPSLSAKIAANKAYILTTALQQNTKALYLNMGEATGIEQVNAEKQATIYYDLNGRRVFYPSNGVFITNTGKKVFIK